MSPLVPIMLFGWIPMVLVLFALMPARKAVISAFLFAWLFLPNASYEIRFCPDYDKTSATCVGVFLAVLIFDSSRLLTFRPKLIDLPVVTLSLCPFLSSISNGLGAYDGLSEAFGQTVAWLLPYFIGRLYFSDAVGQRDLLIGIFIGGLVYVPLCLWEIRMSPQLAYQVYGLSIDFVQNVRYGGYRPCVFMGHGLTVGWWLMLASLSGFWLWQSKSLPHLFGVPTHILLVPVVVTTLLCKAMGPLSMMFVGMAVLLITKYFRTSIPIVALAVIPAAFILVRALGLWDAYLLVDVANSTFGAQRAQSLEVRVVNDTRLAAHARQRPFVGWGGWGRNRVTNEEGRDVSVTDSLWGIKFGVNGFVGLLALLGTILLPPLLLGFRVPPRLWGHPLISPAVLFALVLALWGFNVTVNAAMDPFNILMAGGLSGVGSLAAYVPATRGRRLVVPARSY